MTKMEALYKNCEILSSFNDSPRNHEKEYKTIIKASGGSKEEKRICCQYLPKYFNKFPNLMNDALNAHLDLCEDTDLYIRKLAITSLNGFCEGLPVIVPRIGAILTQMLSSDNSNEFNLVCCCLVNLFKKYGKSVLKGIIDEIKISEQSTRIKALQFIKEHIIKLILNNDSSIQEFIQDLLSIFNINEIQLHEIILILSIIKLSTFHKLFLNTIALAIEQLLQNIKFKDQQQIKYIDVLIDESIYFECNIESYENILKDIFESSKKYVQEKKVDQDILNLLRKLVKIIKMIKNSQNMLQMLYDQIYEILPPSDDNISQEFYINYDYFEPICICFYILYCKYPQFMNWDQKQSNSIKPFREKLHSLYKIITSSTHNHYHRKILPPNSCPNQPNLQGSLLTINSFIKIFQLSPPPINISTIPISWSIKDDNNIIDSSSKQLQLTSRHKRILPPQENHQNTTKIRPSTNPYIPPAATNSKLSQITPPKYVSKSSRKFKKIT